MPTGAKGTDTTARKARLKKGPNELATRKSLREIGDLPPGLAGKAEVALTLAKTLDAWQADTSKEHMAIAAVARELSKILTELAATKTPEKEIDEVEELVRGLGDAV